MTEREAGVINSHVFIVRWVDGGPPQLTFDKDVTPVDFVTNLLGSHGFTVCHVGRMKKLDDAVSKVITIEKV